MSKNDIETGVPVQKNTKLLVVDDSPFFRNLTVPFLKSAGYMVTAAAGAHEAMQEIESAKFVFDAIISDIEMPEIDGFGFAEMCQNHPKANSVPIFAFTSARNERVLEKGKAVGFREIILKTDRAGLLIAIAETLKHKQKEVA